MSKCKAPSPAPQATFAALSISCRDNVSGEFCAYRRSQQPHHCPPTSTQKGEFGCFLPRQIPHTWHGSRWSRSVSSTLHISVCCLQSAVCGFVDKRVCQDQDRCPCEVLGPLRAPRALLLACERPPLRDLVPLPLCTLPTDFTNVSTSGVASRLSDICVQGCVSGAGRGDFENPRRAPGAWGRRC